MGECGGCHQPATYYCSNQECDGNRTSLCKECSNSYCEDCGSLMVEYDELNFNHKTTSVCKIERTRSYHRHHNKRVTKRKFTIVKNTLDKNRIDKLSKPNNFGQLKKGKIHCSCTSCTVKTKHAGYKKSDLSKIQYMEQELQLYLNNNETN